MSTYRLRSCSLLLALLLLWPATTLAQTSPTEPPTVSSRLPLVFAPNAGQVDPRVRYYANGAGLGVYLTADSAVIVFIARAWQAASRAGAGLGVRRPAR